jgi:hypothetical protein
MQVERGKTRPNTMMTGHTGYITHARKIIKLEIPSTSEKQELPTQETVLDNKNIEELAEEPA